MKNFNTNDKTTWTTEDLTKMSKLLRSELSNVGLNYKPIYKPFIDWCVKQVAAIEAELELRKVNRDLQQGEIK